MSTLTFLGLAATATAMVLLVAVAAGVVRAWLRARGTHVVTCPETHKRVAVAIDARHAVSTAVAGLPRLRLSDCSRWPERAGCGQECLAELEPDPAGCLLRNVASRWYEGQACVYCGHHFGPVRWHDHRPALRGPDGALLEWEDVREEELLSLFGTHAPVCWNCAVAERFRRRFPELVVDRPKPPLPARDGHREPYH